MNNLNTTILMYHGIIGDGSDIPEGREIGAEIYDVDSDAFLGQMQYLKDNDFIVDMLDENADAKDKRVILTFDDGERNSYENAFVVLRTFGLRAYFFVTPDRVGKSNYMDWDEIKELKDSGMIIGSHGLTHKMLVDLNDEELEHELVESKRLLEAALQVDVDSISIPRGFCNKRVVKKAKEAGYDHIFVSEQEQKDAKCMTRTAVRANWSIKRFAQALSGKTPLGEKIYCTFRDVVKKILGGSGYDKLRSTLLKAKK